MSASTANRTNVFGVALARIRRAVAASTHIFQGTFTCTDASGNAVPASDTSGLIFDGYAESEANNTGAAGALSVEITPRHGGRLGIVECDAVSPDATWINQEVAIADDHTVALLAQTAHVVRCGRVVSVTAAAVAGRVIIDTNDIVQTNLSGS